MGGAIIGECVTNGMGIGRRRRGVVRMCSIGVVSIHGRRGISVYGLRRLNVLALAQTLVDMICIITM